jgi:hypothetical protein
MTVSQLAGKWPIFRHHFAWVNNQHQLIECQRALSYHHFLIHAPRHFFFLAALGFELRASCLPKKKKRKKEI